MKKHQDFGEWQMEQYMFSEEDNSDLMSLTALSAMVIALVVLFINNTSAIVDLMILSSIW